MGYIIEVVKYHKREEMMDIVFVSQKLASTVAAIRALTQDISPDQARWKPNADAWSMLEVVNHLYDEEREDFRAHLANLLAHPEQPWKEIAPQKWVTERRYNLQDFQVSREKFYQARSESLAWLKDLTVLDWGAAYNLPWGKLTAGDLLVSWAAHDLLSIRQVAELNYQVLALAAQPYHLEYAGAW
jgi:hypothetical protein